MSRTVLPETLIDYGDLEGGLVRMMDRFRNEGTMTGDEEADNYLRENANAALLGMLYDQRVRAEYAFTGPHRLRNRLGHLDMKLIAGTDEDELRRLFTQKPAVHRFPNKMADQTRGVARIVADKYDGEASNMWNDGADFTVVQKRLLELPGFGPQKAHKMKFVLHYFCHRDFSDG